MPAKKMLELLQALEDIRIEERIYDFCANSQSPEIFSKWKTYIEQVYPYVSSGNIDKIFSMFSELPKEKK